VVRSLPEGRSDAARAARGKEGGTVGHERVPALEIAGAYMM